MRKILFTLIFFLTVLQVVLIFPKLIDAKIWNKELIDKAILTIGFSGSVCPIKVDQSLIEKTTAYNGIADPDYELLENEPDCTNKQPILFGKVALDFKETDSLGEEYIFIFDDILLKADSISWDYYEDMSIGAESPPNDKGEIKKGLKSIKSSKLFRTDTNLPDLQEDVPGSGFLIKYDTNGKIEKTLFMHKGNAYLVSSIDKTVSDKVLVDYTTEASQSTVSTSTTIVKDDFFSGELFSFQYPKDWKIVKSDKNQIVLQKQEEMAAQGPYPAQTLRTDITIYSADVKPETTLDEWLEIRYLRGGDTNLFGLTKQSAKKTTLGSAEAIAIQVPGAGGYIDEGTVSVHKNKGYNVSIGGSELKGSTEAYQTVISTFKFLDRADDTSNWKTYLNKEIGIIFKYPSGWTLKENTNESQFTVNFEVLGSTYTFERVQSIDNTADPIIQTDKKKAINGIIWNDFRSSENAKYCDGGECAGINAVYYTFKKGYRYSFYHPIDTPELTEEILSTFKFTN